MGLGTDIETGLPMSLSMNVYAKYQWQNYGAANENEWDGYRFKVKYFVPITQLWGGNLSYIGFTNFDWGSDTGDNDFRDLNGRKARTNDSIASSHIPGAELRSLALLCCCALLAQRWSVERRRQPELRQRRLQRSFYRLGRLPSWVTTSNQCGIVRAGASPFPPTERAQHKTATSLPFCFTSPPGFYCFTLRKNPPATCPRFR